MCERKTSCRVYVYLCALLLCVCVCLYPFRQSCPVQNGCFFYLVYQFYFSPPRRWLRCRLQLRCRLRLHSLPFDSINYLASLCKDFTPTNTHPYISDKHDDEAATAAANVRFEHLGLLGYLPQNLDICTIVYFVKCILCVARPAMRPKKSHACTSKKTQKTKKRNQITGKFFLFFVFFDEGGGG